MAKRKLVLTTPDWTAEEALKVLADHAVVAAHHLLDYAPKDSMAWHAAKGVLNVIKYECGAFLVGEDAGGACPTCGTTLPDSSRRHLRCLADQSEPSPSGDGQEEPTRFHGASPSGEAPSDRLPEPTPDPNRNVSDGQDGSGQNSSLSGSIRPDRQAEVTPGAIGADNP